MADIDSIIAGVSGNTRADFPNFDPAKAFFDANKQRSDFNLRRAFRPTEDNPNGLPMKDGQLDYPSMVKTLIENGALDQGLTVAKLAQDQQNLAASQQIDRNVAGGSPVQFPVSASRANGVADPAFRRDTSTDQPAPGATPLPPDQRQDPNSNVLRMPQEQAVQAWRESVRPAVGGAQPQVQPPTQQGQPQAINIRPQPQQVAQAPPAPDFNSRFSAARPGQGDDPTLGGLIPPGRTVKQQVDLLNEAIASRTLNPDQAKAYHSRLEAIYKAVASDRSDEATTARQELGDKRKTNLQILEKSIIPRIDKAKESADAARNDIEAIHQSRAELDRKGGIISGKWAEDKLVFAKVAELVGINNADKIQNTEAFKAAIGSRVKEMVKNFGSGNGITDADVKFSKQISGGSIELNETSIRRILDIAEKANRNKIDRHNSDVDKFVKANEALKPLRDTFIVKAADDYNAPLSKAQRAIEAGAPRDAVIKRLRDAGHNPAGL